MPREPGEGERSVIFQSGPALENLHVEHSHVRCGTGCTQISASRRPRSAPDTVILLLTLKIKKIIIAMIKGFGICCFADVTGTCMVDYSSTVR
jgi:hypothetical protein